MIEITPSTLPLKDLEEVSNLRNLGKEHYFKILDLILTKRLKELGLDLDQSAHDKILQMFDKVEVVFNLQEVRSFDSQSESTKFAEKLVTTVLTGGFFIDYEKDDGSHSFQVFINDLHPMSDAKRKLIHEFTHVVDSCLKIYFPELFAKEVQTNNDDIDYFLKVGIIGLSAITIANMVAYSLPIPYWVQVVMGTSSSILGAYKMENMLPYKNRPKEIRARENEKLINGRVTRLIKNCFQGIH